MRWVPCPALPTCEGAVRASSLPCGWLAPRWCDGERRHLPHTAAASAAAGAAGVAAAQVRALAGGESDEAALQKLRELPAMEEQRRQLLEFERRVRGLVSRRPSFRHIAARGSDGWFEAGEMTALFLRCFLMTQHHLPSRARDRHWKPHPIVFVLFLLSHRVQRARLHRRLEEYTLQPHRDAAL
jgi:hypothetical protein